MHRGSGRGSGGRFRHRAAKTHRINVLTPLRGGWRL